jgi:sec-independent protein translocase protein TatB
MFDIGFWELCLIFVVALLVVGPERLPGVAYRAGKWFAASQRFFRNAYSELEKELHKHEIQEALDEHKKEIEKITEATKTEASQLKQQAKELFGDQLTQNSSIKNKRNEKKKHHGGRK